MASRGKNWLFREKGPRKKESVARVRREIAFFDSGRRNRGEGKSQKEKDKPVQRRERRRVEQHLMYSSSHMNVSSLLFLSLESFHDFFVVRRIYAPSLFACATIFPVTDPRAFLSYSYSIKWRDDSDRSH